MKRKVPKKWHDAARSKQVDTKPQFPTVFLFFKLCYGTGTAEEGNTALYVHKLRGEFLL